MKNMRFMLLLAILLIPFAAGYAQTAPKIGKIKGNHGGECDCILQLPAKSYPSTIIFQADGGEAGWMNIDGKDVKLKLVSKTELPRRVRKGSRFNEKYQAKDLTVKIDYVVSEEPGEEVIGWNATVTVTKNNRTRTIRVVGGCGC